MSTPHALILAAQERIVPSEVRHTAFPLSLNGVIVLNAVLLRRLTEQRCRDGRALVWDEWLDVRSKWCGRYKAHGIETVRGHTHELPAVAKLASLRGYYYILLEEI